MDRRMLFAEDLYENLDVRTHGWRDAVSRERQRLVRLGKTRFAADMEVFEKSKEAFISHGRWCIICDCMSGNAISEVSNEAACLDCGAIWVNVVYPEQRQLIEAVLAMRGTKRLQHWTPRQTLMDLAIENLSAGFDLPPGIEVERVKAAMAPLPAVDIHTPTRFACPECGCVMVRQE